MSSILNNRIKNRPGDLIEAALFFMLCALPPIAVIHSVGSDEQFFAVKTALVETLVFLLAAARFVGTAARASFETQQRPAAVILAAAGWFALSIAFAANKADAAQAFMYLATLLALYHLAATFPERELLKKAAVAGTIAGALAASVYGILDFLNVTGPALFIDWGDRTASLFSDPNDFGIYLAVPFALAAGALLYGNSGKKARAVNLFFTAVFFIALTLSNSRSAWIAVLAGSLFFGTATVLSPGGDKGKKLKAAAAMFALLAALAGVTAAVSRAPFMRPYNFNLTARLKSIPVFPGYEADPRLLLWKSARDMTKSRPATGYGIGSFYREYTPFQLAYRGKPGFPPDAIRHSTHAYNDYLELAAETGFPGAALWIAALCLFMARALRGARKSGPAALAVCGGCFAYLIDSAFFQRPLFSAAGAALALLWLGVLHDPPRRVDAEPAAAKPVREMLLSPRGAGLIAAAAVMVCAAFVYVPLPVRSYRALNLARTELAKGNADKAAEAAGVAIKLEPGRPFNYLAAAQAHIELAKTDPENYKAAEADLITLLALFPYDSAPRIMLADIYQRRGRNTDALAEYARAEKYEYGDLTQIRFREVSTLMDAYRYGEAADKLEPLIEAAEKRMAAEDLYATINHIRERLAASGMNASILTPEEKIHVKAFNRERGILAQSLWMRGVCLFKNGDARKAAGLLKRATRLSPENRVYKESLAGACENSDAPECKVPLKNPAGGQEQPGAAEPQPFAPR